MECCVKNGKRQSTLRLWASIALLALPSVVVAIIVASSVANLYGEGKVSAISIAGSVSALVLSVTAVIMGWFHLCHQPMRRMLQCVRGRIGKHLRPILQIGVPLVNGDTDISATISTIRAHLKSDGKSGNHVLIMADRGARRASDELNAVVDWLADFAKDPKGRVYADLRLGRRCISGYIGLGRIDGHGFVFAWFDEGNDCRRCGIRYEAIDTICVCLNEPETEIVIHNHVDWSTSFPWVRIGWLKCVVDSVGYIFASNPQPPQIGSSRLPVSAIPHGDGWKVRVHGIYTTKNNIVFTKALPNEADNKMVFIVGIVPRLARGEISIATDGDNYWWVKQCGKDVFAVVPRTAAFGKHFDIVCLSHDKCADSSELQ